MVTVIKTVTAVIGRGALETEENAAGTMAIQEAGDGMMKERKATSNVVVVEVAHHCLVEMTALVRVEEGGKGGGATMGLTEGRDDLMDNLLHADRRTAHHPVGEATEELRGIVMAIEGEGATIRDPVVGVKSTIFSYRN